MYLSIRPGGLMARAVSVEKAAASQRKAQCYRVIHPKKRGIRLITSATSPNGEEPDFWEGDQWEALGNIANVAIPFFIAFAMAVGLFAAQTYNQDATVFLENAKSPEDTAKLYTFDSK